MDYRDISTYQMYYWHHHQLTPWQKLHRKTIVFQLSGELDKEALTVALEHFMTTRGIKTPRHFELKEGVVKQSFEGQTVVDLECLKNSDLGLSHEKDTREIAKFISKSSLSLDKGPLFYFVLIEMEKNEYLLVLNFHEITFASEEEKLLGDYLPTWYAQAVRGETLDVVPLSQRANPKDILSVKSLSHWKKRLSNQRLYIDILSHPDAKQTDYLAKSHYFELSETTLHSLNDYSSRIGVPLSFIYMTAFQYLLSRYASRNETIILRRVFSEGKQLSPTRPNHFIPSQQTFDFNQSWSEMLTQLQEVWDRDKAHEQYPIYPLIDELKKSDHIQTLDTPNISFSECNLSEVKHSEHHLVWQNRILPSERLEGHMNLAFDQFALEKFCLSYQAALFEPWFINQFVTDYMGLLEELPSIAEVPLKETSLRSIQVTPSYIRGRDLLIQAEKPRLMKELLVWPTNRRQTAIIYKNKKYSYEMIDKASDQLASMMTEALGGQSLKVDNCSIGLIFQAEPAMVVSILASVKLGLTFVPIDASIPMSRIAHQLNNSQAVIALTTLSMQETMSASEENLPESMVVDLAELNVGVEEAIQPIFYDNPAPYITYTSGSTGEPKGVKAQLSGFASLLLDMHEQFDLTSQSTILSVTSVAFDIFVSDMFLAFGLGAKFALLDNQSIFEPEAIAKTFHKVQPDYTMGTPTFWSSVIPYLKPQSYQPNILCAGEPLTRALADRLLQVTDRVWNVFGTTETTVYDSFHRVMPNHEITLGQPFADTYFYLLDKEGQLVPKGVPGMLYIGGLGVSSGYQKTPSLTEKKFLNMPVYDLKTGKLVTKYLYRTGDFVKLNEDSDLIYVGRKDDQIKSHGFRIELGEIESTLMEHPEISQCTIKYFKEEDVIVAYYLPIKKNWLSTIIPKSLSVHEDFYEYLRRRLPIYMLPKAFVSMNAFPRTITGKVDKEQLALPKAEQYIEKQKAQSIPGDLIEYQLREIWYEILNRKGISLNDDFFKVGGHSLAAVQLCNKINDFFNMEFPVSWIYQHRLLQEQADFLKLNDDKFNTFKPILYLSGRQHQTTDKAMILIHPSLAGAEVYDNLAACLKNDITCYGVESYNLYSKKPFISSVEALARQYIEYIVTLKLKGPIVLGGWSFGGIVAFEMAHQLKAMDIPVGKLILIDTFLEPQSRYELYANNFSTSTLMNFMIHKEDVNSASNRVYNYLNKMPEKHLNKVTQTVKHDYYMLSQYELKPFDGEALLIKGNNDDYLDPALTEQAYYGWDKYIENIYAEQVDCYHLEIMLEPVVKKVADYIREHLVTSVAEIG